MKNYIEAADRIEEWYSGSFPRKMGAAFQNFAVRTNELANLVLGRGIKMMVVSDRPTSCTDGKTIFLPAGYFLPEYYEHLGVEKAEIPACALACINGSQIHEAFHVRETVCDLKEMIKPFLKDPDAWLKKPGFISCLNLSEDLYIEEWGRANREFLTETFINAKNDVLFPEEMFEAFRAKLTSGEEGNKQILLQMLICLKNIRFKGDERFAPWQEIVNVFEKSRKVGITQKQRVDNAVEAWKLLNEAKAENGDSLSDGDLDDGSNLGSSGPFGSVEKVGIDTKSVEGKDYKAFVEALKSKDGEYSAIEKLEAIAKRVNEELEYQESLKRTFESVKGKWDDPELFPISKLADGLVEANKAFSSFGKYLRRAKEVKHVPGTPQLRGTQLLKHRISHIASDGKILAFNNSNKKKLGKPEVIFLMDFSGSMGGLAHTVLQATLGAHLSLMQAGVPVATYAHTSTMSGDQPALFSIAAFDMPLDDKAVVRHNADATKKRFGKAGNIYKRQNFDGVAIEFVSHRFTKREGSKIIISLSDGEPLGGYLYSGDEAWNHTKKEIGKCRKNGIMVFSLSLVPGVWESNNEIYGKDNNFQAWGDKLVESLKKLSYQITTGGN